MAKAKPRSNPARTTRDQQGARGRVTTNEARQPILAPRVSKVPAQDSDFLTTAQGQRLAQTDDSLKVGSRGPTLMDDFHLREKITHFDHERIPERVVHARGTAAHGVFESYGTAVDITSADFLQPGRVTPVFTRFSTVVGSRGSADTVRDVRGFAVKFYTDEGVFDLVGNNIRCSLFGTESSSPISSTRQSRNPTARYRRHKLRTRRSGIWCRCFPSRHTC